MAEKMSIFSWAELYGSYCAYNVRNILLHERCAHDILTTSSRTFTASSTREEMRKLMETRENVDSVMRDSIDKVYGILQSVYISIQQAPCPFCGEVHESMNAPWTMTQLTGSQARGLGYQTEWEIVYLPVCQECLNGGVIRRCEHCRKSIIPGIDETILLPRGGPEGFTSLMCRECAEDATGLAYSALSPLNTWERPIIDYCHICGKPHVMESMTKVENNWRSYYFCQECIEERIPVCVFCDEPVYPFQGEIELDDGVFAVFAHELCAIDNGYSRCEDCDNWFQNDLLFSNYGRTLCEHCRNGREENEYSEIIEPYHSHSRSWQKFGSGPVHFGLELEVEVSKEYYTTNDVAFKLREVLEEHAFFEEDGSLCYGFEIITQPHTPELYLTAMRWQEMFNAFCQYELEDADTCGFHIHINRSAFTHEEGITRLRWLFDQYRDEMLAIGRRDSSTAQSFAPCCYHKELCDRDMKKHKELSNSSGNRRYAVNVNNRNTVEIRMWAGTTDYDVFRATILFTEILVEYVNKEEWNTETVFEEIIAEANKVVVLREYFERVLPIC